SRARSFSERRPPFRRPQSQSFLPSNVASPSLIAIGPGPAHRFEARNAPAGGGQPAQAAGTSHGIIDFASGSETGSVELAPAAARTYLTSRGSVGAVPLVVSQLTTTSQPR